jgi:hypothetical protein
VNVLNVKVLLMAFLIFALTSGGMAMAQGVGQKTQSSIIVATGDQSGQNMDGMDMSGKDKNMDMSSSKKDDSSQGMDMNGKDKNMDMSGSKKDDNMAGMDMGEKPIKETPPNAKVLGTYGAVNAAFIIIGVWNKWFRRKDGSDGNTK